ncbi:hypothetical protein GCM10027517_19940 [Phycicoccus ginsengisoli]
MTDVGTGFLHAVSAFGTTRLGRASSSTWHDTGSLMSSLVDGVPDNTKPAFEQLKSDIEQAKAIVEPIVKAIDKQTKVIAKMASDCAADINVPGFSVNEATRIATRIGTALLAMDEAVRIVARELSKDAQGHVQQPIVDQLMEAWNPWVKPFQDLADGAGKVVDSLGKELLGVDHATKSLGDVLSWDQANFRLAAQLVSTGQKDYGVLRLNETRLEAFLSFKEREFLNPSEEDKKSLVERSGKWYRADESVLGLRIYTVIKPGLQNDPLLKKVMPGSTDPETIKPTAITLDSVDGLYLGDGRGAGNEKAVLPVQFNFPMVEIREVALGIVRNPAKEVTGLELTTIIAAKLGSAVGMQIGGAGAVIGLDGQPTPQSMFPIAFSPRWPDRIGLRIKAGPVTGGGYLERVTRTYDGKELVEFGGVLQLEILKVGVYAIGLLSPDPFSMVVVMGVRFPTAIELSFGFTFNGVGGMLAINRTVDTDELVKGMKDHFIDKVLFPDDPVAEAPTLLNKVAKVFPPRDGGFVVGPIIELGWGSQTKMVEAKLGVVLSLPDPKLIILGAIRIQAPAKVAPVTDIRCEVFGEVTSDHLLVIARMSNSKIALIDVSGDLGLLIQWGGTGAFALSIGGFHPRYKDAPKELAGLERVTIDLSPVKDEKGKGKGPIKIVVTCYFAVTAGAIMAGVKGDFKADVAVASAHAWLSLDMIFYWVPRFGFAIDLEIGLDIEVFGCSFASVSFKGSLQGTKPWSIEGTATIDVWFLPTFHFDLGPVTWGDPPPPLEASTSPLALVQQGLQDKDAWKARQPLDGDLLASLAAVDASADQVLAHPLAVLEVTQSRLPLETHVERVGSSGLTANRVNLGLPTVGGLPANAVSTVTAPFSPGQFLALRDEALLAQSGFAQLPSGCAVSAATTPVHGTPQSDTVRWHTYFPGEEAPVTLDFDPRMFADVMVAHSLVGRLVEDRDNPYLSRVEKVRPDADRKVSVLPAGTATLRRADDGTGVLGDLGVLDATEAARVARTVNDSGEAVLAAVAVGVL